jgi:CheY-like chemotaxis protein
MKPYQILTIGRTPDNLKEAVQTLAPDRYTILVADTEEHYLDQAANGQVDLAFLELMDDTNSPSDLCKKLKKNKSTKSIPIIISTPSKTTSSIVSYFESGAFDVLTPDAEPEYIQKRLDVAINTYHAGMALEKKLKRAKETAFSAMEDSSELGKIITFMERSASCMSYAKLAELCFATFTDLNVSGSLVFHTRKNDLYFSDDQSEKPLELKLIQKFKEVFDNTTEMCSRFKTFSNRIMIASSQCSLLVRNAPEDPVKQGRMRDILGALINGLDSRAQSIAAELTHERSKEMTKKLIALTRNTMVDLEVLFSEHEKETTAIMDNLMYRTEEGLSILGLTEEQENYFFSLIEHSMARLVTLYRQGVEIENHFQNILQALTKLCGEL